MILDSGPNQLPLPILSESNIKMDSIQFKCLPSINAALLNESEKVNNLPKWTILEPKRLAISIYNFRAHVNRTKSGPQSSDTLPNFCQNFLEFCLGQILVIVEHFSDQWYRGYTESNPLKLGIFPVSFVKVFDHHTIHATSLATNQHSETFTPYYYSLLDPLFLQAVRSIREWHGHILEFYRNNSHIEKYQSVRKLIYKLIDLISILGRDLAPTLWRRRCSQILKSENLTKDPFIQLYLDEDNNDGESGSNTDNRSLLEPSLEELYDQILSRLNIGNQLLNLEVMPSFTYGTFANDNCTNYSQLIRRHSSHKWALRMRHKFQPYFARDNSKYLMSILAYYNRLNHKFVQKFHQPANSNQTLRGISHSFHSPLHSQSGNHHHYSSDPSNTSQKFFHDKCRRHLLFCIREANFSSLFSNLNDSEQSTVLQIDVHLVRCDGSSYESSPWYQILTEKYCYRIRTCGQQVISSNKLSSWGNINRALFLDVLSKKRSNPPNSSSSTAQQHLFTSQHSDSANYYLVIQVWRYGKMLLNESRTKNMLSATMSSASASLSSGTSVFHTISSNSLSSATSAVAAAASTTSLSSISSFVSNFSVDKSTASSTPDSSSIDSSEFGPAGSFKRSVGFAVVPLLELVSRDQELKANGSGLKDESVISKVLLADEPLLLAVPIKLYEGDLTSSALETMLKHRQSAAISSNTLPFSSSTSSSSSNLSSSIAKLSPLTGNYQLVVCAKFVTEHLTPSYSNSMSIKLSSQMLGDPVSNGLDSGNNCISSQSSNSLADWLLLSHYSMRTQTILSKQNSENSMRIPSFVVIQKRFFGDLITTGYLRNDFYLTLESADFEKGGKAIPKNVEVSVCLITENGIQERALSSGANDDPITFYRSHIQYHQNSPKWSENLKINIPLDLFETAHLRFTFYHCSSKERERKFIGFSFIPLANHNGACLPNGDHELFIYKCDNERKLDDVSFYLNVPWGNNEKTAISSGNSTSSSSIASSSTTSSSSTSLAATSSLYNSRSSKEIFHIRTSLVSSKLTQNSEILSLLKWSCMPLDQVYDALQRISRVPGEEMVKFLEDILDALFTLFATAAGSLECSQQITIIFRVLVDFFKTLNDPKFASYRTALESYIENQFSAPLVHPGLMACIKKYIELVIISFQADTISPSALSGVTKRELEFILRCLSVFDWILKIIVQSRILYTQASASGASDLLLDSTNDKKIDVLTPEAFRCELFSLFSSINRLLMVESKSSDDYLIIAIQEAVLNTLPNAFSYLSKILSPFELSKLIKSIVHSSKSTNEWSPMSSISTTPTNSNTLNSSKKTIVNAKLGLLQETIRCHYVWLDDEARIELLDTFIRLLNVCITESKICLSILHDIVLYLIENSSADCRVSKTNRGTNLEKRYFFETKHHCEREIDMLSFGAIDAIVEHIIELTGVVSTGSSLDLPLFNSNFKRCNSANSSSGDEEDYLGNYILCFIVLLDCMTLKQYEKLFETRSYRQCKELIIHIFMVFFNALYYFNDTWLEIKMAVNRAILKSLALLRTIMSLEFLGNEKFDITIWRTYLKLAIAFITQPRLQLDRQPHWKRQFILDTYGGDMRIMMSLELVTCWNLIGSSKISFIPSLVSSFVDVTLVPELQLREATIPIFYDMLVVDYDTNSNLKQVEATLIDKLDAIAHKQECDVQYRDLFSKIISNQIEKHKPTWYFDGLQLVKSIYRLLTLLIDYRQELKCKISATKQSASSVDNSLLICTYTLLRFYRDEIDSTNRKSIMLRYVDKLASFHAMLGNHAEAAFTLKLHVDQLSWSTNEWQKKESIYENMLKYFEQGQCWEEGIKVCKALQDIYEHNYKFAKLSVILKRHAQLLDNILNDQRVESEYFRVSFYGLKFKSFLQNSTFIFRGLPYEKISNFTHRIQQEFPNAQLLTKNIPSEESITESYNQYIQVFLVKPIPEPPVLPDETLIFGIPDDVLNYYNSNSIRQFVQDRPIQRAPFDANNEFKSLWIERTIFTTEKALPGILRMFQVVSTQVTYLSPIENACETIENMSNELSKLISIYSNEQSKLDSISPLSMRLQGILDAAVNGGIAKYIDAFLGTEFLQSNPDQVANVTLLKNRIAHQTKILEAGLALHGRLAPIPIRPLHTRLLERFSTMRNTVNQASIETSQVLHQWIPFALANPLNSNTPTRPSILSQPLPPIPYIQRQDTSSDPETSSLSSSSSLTQSITSQEKAFQLSIAPATPATPPTQPPPLPPSLSVPVTSSPSGKSLKNKPLPPLPPSDILLINGSGKAAVSSISSNTNLANNRLVICASEQPPLLNQINDIKQSQQQPSGTDDCIYSVPQLPDIMMDCYEKGSSVDGDSLDYFEDSFLNSESDHPPRPFSSRNIYRSRSIPRSSLSNYNSCVSKVDIASLPPLQRGQSNQNLNELSEGNCSPPPLPPRSSTLDRSNSLNSGVRSSPLIMPLIPPALPRRTRRISSISNPSCPSGTVSQPNNIISTFSSKLVSEADVFFENAIIDGIEFENLVISSPTPRTDSTHSSNRPAPIIGIEINDSENDLFPNPLINVDSMSTLIDRTGNGIGVSPIQTHRSKSNSLPRMQQLTNCNLDSSSSNKISVKVDHSDSIVAKTITTNGTRVKLEMESSCEINSSLLD